ncbi:hypothetical protein NDU88_000833 [Pleurodeles waltl]|uniref:Uncharacterized protein n=1 Tax=Pleurodeles waltl TaxID=8319 RepID=A0AAV7LZ86_PLEWA|nr:hypothetical protein NDU88_000833 [Pleurodeles waltl]
MWHTPTTQRFVERSQKCRALGFAALIHTEIPLTALKPGWSLARRPRTHGGERGKDGRSVEGGLQKERVRRGDGRIEAERKRDREREERERKETKVEAATKGGRGVIYWVIERKNERGRAREKPVAEGQEKEEGRSRGGEDKMKEEETGRESEKKRKSSRKVGAEDRKEREGNRKRVEVEGGETDARRGEIQGRALERERGKACRGRGLSDQGGKCPPRRHRGQALGSSGRDPMEFGNALCQAVPCAKLWSVPGCAPCRALCQAVPPVVACARLRALCPVPGCALCHLPYLLSCPVPGCALCPMPDCALCQAVPPAVSPVQECCLCCRAPRDGTAELPRCQPPGETSC